MKRILLTLAALSLALTGFFTSPAAHAAVPIRQPCLISVDQCMNNWGGVQSNANPVKFWVSGNTFNDWAQYDLGVVVGSSCGQPGEQNCWPFPTGSGMNASFNGETVYLFQWYDAKINQISPYCLDSGNFNSQTGSGNMYIWKCNGPNINQMFVFDSPANKKLLVSVGASTVGYDNHTHWPSWLGAKNGTADGASVSVSEFPGFAGSWQFEGAA